MAQFDEIFELADKLGIDYSNESLEADKKKLIAERLGLNGYNNVFDNDELIERLREAQRENQLRNDSDISSRNAGMAGARRDDGSLTSNLRPIENEQGVTQKNGQQVNPQMMKAQQAGNRVNQNVNSRDNKKEGSASNRKSLSKGNNGLDFKQRMAKKTIETAASAAGLGAVAKSSIGQQLINNKLQHKSPFSGLGAGLGAGNSNDEGIEEGEASNLFPSFSSLYSALISGSSGIISKKAKKWTLIIGIPSCLVIFVCCILLVAAQSHVTILGIDASSQVSLDAENTQKKLSGGESILEKDEIDNLITEKDAEAFIDIFDDKSSGDIVSVTLVARTHEANIDDLSDYFSTEKVCKKGTIDCYKRAEYRFYLKMFDLYYLYRNKYHVKLDLPLIMSTLVYNNDQINVVFKMNLSDYDRKLIVESDWNPKETTELDWDYDYESKDNYLVSNDFSMDMQVLAKNMVSRTMTQKCVKDGKTIKTSKVKDNEPDLQCGEGENLEKGSSTYELDKEKYDDFLLEYIEKKYYLSRKTDHPVISNGPDYVSNKYPSTSTSSGKKNGSSSQQPSATGIEAIDKMISIGTAQTGNTGPYYRTWFYGGYDSSVDWCAIFVSWLFDQIGGLDKYIVKTAGAGSIPRESVQAGLGNWYESEYTDPSTVPRAGDVVVFTWNGAGHYSGHDAYFSDHVGFVYEVDDENIYTIEGNTGSGGCNASIVQLRSYNRKSGDINGYFRPNY